MNVLRLSLKCSAERQIIFLKLYHELPNSFIHICARIKCVWTRA